MLDWVTVGDVMDVAPPTVGPEVTVYEAVFDHLVRGAARALMVCEGERVVGILSITDVKKIPPAYWGERSVAGCYDACSAEVADTEGRTG